MLLPIYEGGTNTIRLLQGWRKERGTERARFCSSIFLSVNELLRQILFPQLRIGKPPQQLTPSEVVSYCCLQPSWLPPAFPTISFWLPLSPTASFLLPSFVLVIASSPWLQDFLMPIAVFKAHPLHQINIPPHTPSHPAQGVLPPGSSSPMPRERTQWPRDTEVIREGETKILQI